MIFHFFSVQTDGAVRSHIPKLWKSCRLDCKLLPIILLADCCLVYFCRVFVPFALRICWLHLVHSWMSWFLSGGVKQVPYSKLKWMWKTHGFPKEIIYKWMVFSCFFYVNVYMRVIPNFASDCLSSYFGAAARSPKSKKRYLKYWFSSWMAISAMPPFPDPNQFRYPVVIAKSHVRWLNSHVCINVRLLDPNVCWKSPDFRRFNHHLFLVFSHIP